MNNLKKFKTKKGSFENHFTKMYQETYSRCAVKSMGYNMNIQKSIRVVTENLYFEVEMIK